MLLKAHDGSCAVKLRRAEKTRLMMSPIVMEQNTEGAGCWGRLSAETTSLYVRLLAVREDTSVALSSSEEVAGLRGGPWFGVGGIVVDARVFFLVFCGGPLGFAPCSATLGVSWASAVSVALKVALFGIVFSFDGEVRFGP